MALASSPRPRLLTGLVLLGCWLGWITATFAAIGTRAEGDGEVLRATLRTFADAVPSELSGAPLAIRLTAAQCACPAADQQWQRIQAQLASLDGHALSLPGRRTDPAVPELVVLAADGSAVYAGPILPVTDSCGGALQPLTQWLPRLLSTGSAPLLLPSRCSC